MASKENFQRAIEAKASGKLCLQDSRALGFFDAIVLPYRTLLGKRPTNAMLPFDVQEIDATKKQELEALQVAKLIAKRTTILNIPHDLVYGAKRTTVEVPVAVYDRGPDFAQYAPDAKPGPVGVGSLCYAALQVDHIDNFSVPGQMMGATVSQVNFHAKVGTVAPWAMLPAMRAAFPNIGQQLDEAARTQRTEMVVLMSDGWQAQ